jgi:hypothetical protein
MLRIRALAAGLALLGAATAGAAVTEENFRLRSGNDLLAVCSVDADDPLRDAAIHLCHGFGAGTYQTILALTTHEKLEPILCPPDPPPSRREAVAKFVEWARAHPERLTEPAVEVVGRFLIESYGCAKAAP